MNFIRYLPNGRTSPEVINRGPAVEEMARKFARAGGRYLITINQDAEVEMVAAMPGMVIGNVDQYATATCSNDPVLPHAVDQLVRDSVSELDRRGEAKYLVN